MSETRVISEKTYKAWPVVAWGHKEPGMICGRPVVKSPDGKFWCAVDSTATFAGNRGYLIQEAVTYKEGK